MTEFNPSIRLLVAFSQRPDLFRDLRNAGYLEAINKPNHGDEYHAWETAKQNLIDEFPTLEEEITTLDVIWENYDA